MSEATAPVRDSSLADLIGPWVVLLLTHPAALQGSTYVVFAKNQCTVARAAPPPAILRGVVHTIARFERPWRDRPNRRPATKSAFPVKNAVQGVQGPGYAITYLRLRLLQVAYPGFRTLQIGPQSVPLTLQCREAVLGRLSGIGALGLAARHALACGSSLRPRLLCAAPGRHPQTRCAVRRIGCGTIPPNHRR
jgi:hypothetical protein